MSRPLLQPSCTVTRRGFLRSAAGIAAVAALRQPLVRAAAAAVSRSTLLADLSGKLSGRVLTPSDADFLAWSVSTAHMSSCAG
jgi:hypothetical protein